jgi:hypothetical protein
MTLSLICLIVSGTTPEAVTVALNVVAVMLCVYAVRVAWPSRRHDRGPDDSDDPDA